MADHYVSDTAIFEAVADALVQIEAPDRIKRSILAATMDQVGVPMMSLERYRDDEAIVALFAERGVRFVTEADGAV